MKFLFFAALLFGYSDLLHADSFGVYDPSGSYIVFMDQDSYPKVVSLTNAEGKPFDLPLGAYSPKFYVQFNRALNTNSATVRVKLLRGLSIMGDGPHLDYRDYQQESKWFDLAPVDGFVWGFTPPDQISYSHGKPIDIGEIKERIKKSFQNEPPDLQNFWLDRASECKPPFEGSCIWVESRLLLKIESTDFNKEFELLIPMGC